MKRILFFAVAVVSLGTVATAQSNKSGTISFGLNGAVTIGSTKTGDGESELKGAGVGVNYGIWGQYGLAESFSAGININAASLISTVSVGEGGLFSADTSLAYGGLNISAEGRYYISNKDRFNFYVYPQIGFTSLKPGTVEINGQSTDIGTDAPKLAGLSYGLGLGINWYFSDFIGGNFRLGYEGNSLSGNENAKLNYGGVSIQGGIAFKIN